MARVTRSGSGPAEARLFYAQLLTILGRWEEAAEQARIGVGLDPLNPFAKVLFAQVLTFQRRYEEAIGVLEDMYRRNPGAGGGIVVLSGLYHLVGRYEDAFRVTRDSYQARGALDVVAALDRGYSEAGYPGAMRMAAETLAARAEYVGPIDIARLYVRAGESEKAIEWLERAFEVGGAGPALIGVVPIWERLHAYPRFQALARRINVPILKGSSDGSWFGSGSHRTG